MAEGATDQRFVAGACAEVENVSAVLHDRSGVVDRTAKALAGLGYYVDHAILDCADLGGPQHRKRHVLVGSRSRAIDLRSLVATSRRPPLTVGQAIGDLRIKHEETAFDGVGRPTKVNRRRMKYLFDRNVYDLPDRLRPACHRDYSHSSIRSEGRLLQRLSTIPVRIEYEETAPADAWRSDWPAVAPAAKPPDVTG